MTPERCSDCDSKLIRQVGETRLLKLDEAVERDGQRHQRCLLLGPDISDGAKKFVCGRSRAIAQCIAVPTNHSAQQGRESPASLATSGAEHPERFSRPDPAPAGSNRWRRAGAVPPRRRIAELRLIDAVVCHGEKAHVDLPFLASADTINRRLPSPWP